MGTQKKEWRLVRQWTRGDYNHTYTRLHERLESEQHEPAEIEAILAGELEHIRYTYGKPFWQVPPEYSTYELFACWEIVKCYPVMDADESLAQYTARPFKLTLNARRQELVDFLDTVPTQELSVKQLISLHRVEFTGRRYHPDSWQEPIRWKHWGLPDER